MQSLKPLRLGVAGLGTVGAGLVSLLNKNGAAIAARSGRRIEVAGVCARSRGKDRGVDLSRIPWFDSAIALAQSDTIERLCRVDRRR